MAEKRDNNVRGAGDDDCKTHEEVDTRTVEAMDSNGPIISWFTDFTFASHIRMFTDFTFTSIISWFMFQGYWNENWERRQQHLCRLVTPTSVVNWKQNFCFSGN